MSLLYAIGALPLAVMHSVLFWPIFELATILFVWLALIRPTLKAYHYTSGILDQLDAATKPFWTNVRLWLKGMWTTVIAMATAVFAGLPDLLDKLTGVKWDAFFDSAMVAKITAAIMLLTAIVHVYEMKSAAETVPRNDDAGGN